MRTERLPAADRAERTIEFRSGEHTLVGTLRLPVGDGPFPVAVLVPGSGPVDRDSDVRRMPLAVTRHLAEALADVGVATVRYDKRGVGASTGTFLTTGFHDGTDDVAAAVAHARGLPEVDAARTVLVGHSEGAAHAAAVAARTPDLAGVVLLSAAASPGDEVGLWQAAQIAPTLPGPVRGILRLLRIDLAARVRRNQERLRSTTKDVVRMDGARLNARWFREFLAHDPRTDLARITAPVLAITGEADVQVPVTDLRTIAATVPGPVETVALPEVSHLLRRTQGRPGMRDYKAQVRLRVDATVLTTVAGWVARVTGATTG